MDKRKLIAALVCTFLFGLAITFVSKMFINNIRETQQGIIINHMESVRSILALDIQFLRARKAEKNMLLFRDAKYKEEVESYLQEARVSLSGLKASGFINQDADIFVSIENNLADYNSLFEKLIRLIGSDSYAREDVASLTEDIRQLNDIFANNVESLLSAYSVKIEQELGLLNGYLAKVSLFLIIMLPISLVVGYFTGNLLFLWDIA